MVLHARDGRIIHGNELSCRLLGYGDDEISQKSIVDITVGFSYAQWNELASRTQRGEPVVIDTFFLTKADHLIAVTLEINPFSENGEDRLLAMIRSTAHNDRHAHDTLDIAALHPVVDMQPDPSCLIDIAGTLLYANNDFVKIFGYTTFAELQSSLSNTYDLIAMPDRMRVKESLDFLVHHKVIKKLHYNLTKKDGSSLSAEISARLLREFGFEDIICVAIRDIAKRHYNDLLAANEHQQLLSIFDSIDEVIYITDPQTNTILFANEAFKKRFGRYENKKCYYLLQNLDQPCPFCTNKTILGQNLGNVHIWEFQNRINGHWYRCIDRAIKWPDGRWVRYEMALDINDRKEAEEKLRKSQERYRLLIENQTELVVKLDPDFRFIFVSPLFCETTAKKESDLLGKPFLSQLYKENQRNTTKSLQSLFTPPHTCTFEHKILTTKGLRDISWSAKAILSGNGSIQSIVVIGRDITDQNRAKKLLQEKAAFVLNNPAPIIQANEAGIIVMCNPAATAFFERELLDKSLETVFPNLDLHVINDHKPHQIQISAKDSQFLFTLKKDTDTRSFYVYGSDITEINRIQEELRTSRKHLLEAQRIAHIGNWTWHIQNDHVLWSDEVYRIIGISQEDVPGGADKTELFNRIVHPDDTETVYNAMATAIREHTPYILEFRIRRPDGTIRIVKEHAEIYYDADGKPQHMIGTIQDITELKKTEQALKESEERFRALAENTSDMNCIVAPDGLISYISPAIRSMGYTQEEMIGKRALDFIHPDDRDTVVALLDLARSKPGQTVKCDVCRFAHKEGHYWYLEGLITCMYDVPGVRGMVGNFRDITARLMNERTIAESLQEKELLLREIHHRVKNNMQIISSLLYLQADHTGDPNIFEAFSECQKRIKTMSLIHESLYHSNELSKIDFQAYLNKLVSSIFQSYKVPSRSIGWLIDAPVYLTINQSIPCGLIVNELVSNCLKYAFKERNSGTVSVNLLYSENMYVLTVSDDGIGMPPDFEIDTIQTLGLQIIATLVKQLKGTLSIHNDAGAVVTIRFPR